MCKNFLYLNRDTPTDVFYEYANRERGQMVYKCHDRARNQLSNLWGEKEMTLKKCSVVLVSPPWANGLSDQHFEVRIYSAVQ